MNLNRRQFIKGLLSATAIASIPVDTLEAFYSGKSNILDTEFLRVDLDKKLIQPKSEFSLSKFYRELEDIWNKPEMMDEGIPMVRHTDNMFKMVNDWRICPTSMAHLSDGSLTQGDELWWSVITMGNLK